MTDVSREIFIDHLHDALNHLYNADQLRKSPLADLFHVGSRFDTSSVLRKILTDSIESLKPPASEPDTSKAWRTYESLYCCFIQQLNQQVVADQLCISARQLRREQRNALEYLADQLWQDYSLSGQLPSAAGAVQRPPALNGDEPPAPSALIGELGWLMEAQPVKPNHVIEEVKAAEAVVQGLVQKTGVSLRLQIPADLPGLAIHPVAFNQILVSLLGLAIQEAGAGVVTVTARKLPVAVEMLLQVVAGKHSQPDGGKPAAETDAENSTSLQIASELARLSGGRLYTASNGAGGPFPIRVVLPALEQVPVLVVDDNEDSLQLMKRYAAGTRYHVVVTRDTDAVLNLVESIQPRMVVLDIMMPKENGWIVLGRLRQHPRSAETPIIICTILPQETLALSLGASAFLKKPVSRQAFLQSLDQQFALLEPEFQ